MADADEQKAPDLGEATDIDESGAAGAAGTDSGGGITPAGDDSDEQTIDTPDELGGTGGTQAGGAG